MQQKKIADSLQTRELLACSSFHLSDTEDFRHFLS
jgi:hypothetical protein